MSSRDDIGLGAVVLDDVQMGVLDVWVAIAPSMAGFLTDRKKSIYLGLFCRRMIRLRRKLYLLNLDYELER